jgi:hypothetical protein
MSSAQSISLSAAMSAMASASGLSHPPHDRAHTDPIGTLGGAKEFT